MKLRAASIRETNLTPPSELRMMVAAAALSPDNVGRLKHILTNHPGSAPVFVDMTAGNGRKLLRLDDRFRVDLTSSLYAELRTLFGAEAWSEAAGPHGLPAGCRPRPAPPGHGWWGGGMDEGGVY